MSGTSRFLLIVFLLHPALAIAQAPTWRSVNIRSAGSKTLFTWNGQQAVDEGPDDPRLVTDRPHFSEASSLVGLGVVQLETGYSIFSDRENGTRTTTHSFSEPLLRMGVFAEWFEFRLASNYLVERTSANTGSRTDSGTDDMYLGAKVALTEQAGLLPELAVFPQMRLPTGNSAFSSTQVLPGVNIAYSWKLNDLLEVECNTQFNNRRDDLAHIYLEAIQTLNLEYDLSDRVGAFTELIGFFPCGALIAKPEYYFHSGFVFFLSENVQLDIHAGIGLNKAATDLAFTGAGLSWRY
jgi:hypothetical protein